MIEICHATVLFVNLFISFSCLIFISRISMLNKSGESKYLLGPDLQRKAFINNDVC
jgi:hypothetical protein